MALPETSPLDDSLSRILGQPATPAQPSVSLAPLTNPINYDLTTPGSLATTTSLGAEQPYVDPATAAAVTTAPAATSAVTTPIAPVGLGAGKPQLSYADQLRSDLALSGVTGNVANDIVSRDLANRGYTAETMYDPATMALHPEIAARPADFQTTTKRIGNPVTLGTWKPK